MSKRKVPSLDRSKATSEGSLDSYQSVWFARWKAAKKSPRNKSNFLSLNGETRESDSYSGQEVTSSPSHVTKMDRQLCKVPVKSKVNVKAVTTKVEDIVDGTAVAMISQDLSDQEPISVPSLVLGLTLPDNATSTSINERASDCSYDGAWNPLGMQSSSKNWIDGYVDGSKRRFASENFMGKKSIMVSTPFQGSPLLPSSEHNTDGERLNDVSANTPSLRNRALPLLSNDKPPTGQEKQLTFLTENSNDGFLGHHQAILSQSSPLEATKPETLCSENPSGQRHHVVDVKSTTTHTFVDSNEGLTSGQPTFSQTTHQLFYSEKTDTPLSKSSQIFRDSTVYTNHGGNDTLGQFLSLSMKSLTDSEEHENHVKGRTSVVALKNKSSAETNTLDMDALPMKLLTGDSSSFPKKEPSSVEGSGCTLKVDLRYRKRKFLALAIPSSSTEDDEPSALKTQSFDAEHLLPHEDPGSHSNPGGPEHRHPWMKQLKATEPDHPLEILKMEDESPVKKEKDLLGGISMERNVTSAQTTKDCASTAVDNPNAQKARRALLSDPWIHRWRANRAAAFPEKKEPVVRCDPFGTKTFGDRRDKNMPSAAALALMCKSMNGFHPCEFKRRGCYLMWNS